VFIDLDHFKQGPMYTHGHLIVEQVCCSEIGYLSQAQLRLIDFLLFRLRL